jgi:hypothetical protein
MSKGFSEERIYNMTLRQISHYIKVAMRLNRIDRLIAINDLRASTAPGDDVDFNRYMNALKFE